MADFELIKREVSIEKAVDMLGLLLKRKNRELRGPCPACKSGGDHPLSVTVDGQYRNTFTCWAQKKPARGDVIALVAHILAVEQKDAGNRIAKHFGLDNSSTAPSPTTEGQLRPGEIEELDLDPLHDDVTAVGITSHTANAIGAGYCARGFLRGRVAFPIRTSDGRLVGYCGIGINVDPPFKFHDSLEDRATGNIVKLDRRKA